MLPLVVKNIVRTEQQRILLIKILFLNFVFLCFWVYIYQFLRILGIIRGSLRPSFPFSNEYTFSDAHLYSSYLVFFFLAYIFYIRRILNHRIITSIFVSLNSIIAIFLTGSRTPWIVMFVSVILWSIMHLMQKMVFIRHFYIKPFNVFQRAVIKRNGIQQRIRSFFLFTILVIILVFFFSTQKKLYFFYDFLDSAIKLISRFTYFDLNNDASFIARKTKFKLALADSEYTYFTFGKGFFASLEWYDNIVAAFIAHGGFILLVIILFLFVLVSYKILRSSLNLKTRIILLILVFSYFSSNMSAEFVFVTRNSFPIITFLTLMYLEKETMNMKK
jgi:hypothetical protein